MTDDYLGPEPTADDSIADLGRSIERNHQIAMAIKADRDRYEAALRKIALWKGYTITGDYEYERYQRGYEAGVNDMLSTLQQMAKEALS